MGYSRDKDISIRMTSFFMRCVGFWVANNRTERYQIKCGLCFTIIIISASLSTEVQELGGAWGDINEATYIMCNILCLALVLLKIVVLSVNKQKFRDLILYTEENFWQASYDPCETSILIDCKNISTLFMCSFVLFNQCAVQTAIISSICDNYGKNSSDRNLLYEMSVDVPLTSPYFEILYLLQVMILLHISICYFCFDNVLCLMNIHVAGQFRILQYRLTSAYKNELKEQLLFSNDTSTDTDKYSKIFKDSIRHHQRLIEYCNKIENIFSINILGQILIFDVLICLTGYQVLLADADATRKLLYIFHILGSLCELFMFTYSCNGIIEESSKVGTAAYVGLCTNLPISKSSRMLWQDLKLVIMKSQRNCCLTAGGFFPVSLQTYTMILSTAMSYFTLLKGTINEEDSQSNQS